MTHSHRAEGRYPYPFVECGHHRGPQEGYGICTHVMAGAAVGYFEHASETEIGIISCELPPRSHGPKDLVLACAGCAMAYHAAAIEWLQKGNRHGGAELRLDPPVRICVADAATDGMKHLCAGRAGIARFSINNLNPGASEHALQLEARSDGLLAEREVHR